MEALGLLLHGFAVLMTWKTLALMMVGLVLGIFVGVLPGLGGPNGVAILLPLTFTMDPTSAIVMLSSIYWGALFGGSVTSILFNIPGEPSSVATTFDGYPMARDGRPTTALATAFGSAAFGALVVLCRWHRVFADRVVDHREHAGVFTRRAAGFPRARPEFGDDAARRNRPRAPRWGPSSPPAAR